MDKKSHHYMPQDMEKTVIIICLSTWTKKLSVYDSVHGQNIKACIHKQKCVSGIPVIVHLTDEVTYFVILHVITKLPETS